MSIPEELCMVMQVWNDPHNDRIEVGEDREGLGLLEIRWVSDDGMYGSEIRIKPEKAPILLDAIKRVSEFLLQKQNKDF